MSNNKTPFPDALLLWVGLLLGIIFVGPALALQFKLSATQMAIILTPILVPVVTGIVAVLVVKFYWNRY